MRVHENEREDCDDTPTETRAEVLTETQKLGHGEGTAHRKEHTHMNEQQHDLSMQEMSDQEVIHRYVQEILKLKVLNQFGRRSEQFLGYPNTLIMKRCKREMERRGLPIPPVNPTGKDENNTDHSGNTPDESSVSVRKDDYA